MGPPTGPTGHHCFAFGNKPLRVQIDDCFLLVVEPDAVSGTQHNLQNRSKSRFVSAGCLLVDDNTRADVEFSMSFSLFHVLPPVQFHPTLTTSRGDMEALIRTLTGATTLELFRRR